MANKVTAGKHAGIEHIAEPRNEARLLLEVDVEPQNGTSICGQHVKHGLQKVIVYKSELDAVAERVRTPEHEAGFKVATGIYESKLDAHMTRAAGREWREALSDSSHRLFKAARDAHDRYGESSPWAEFAAMNRTYRTGMPPLKSLKVLGDVPPPDTQEARADRADDRLAQFAQLVAEAIAGKQPQQQSQATGGNKR